MENKRAQLTIFIIIAIVLIGLVAGYFIYRSILTTEKVPRSIEPAYNSFLSCLEDDTRVGIGLLGLQAGYIEMPKFESGSTYMPFSSQLDFLGNPVPYWYYVSGNNIQKEQVPTLSSMESELASFVQEKIKICKFNDSFYDRGFEISFDVKNPKAIAKIQDNKVELDLNMKISFVNDKDSAIITSHKVVVNSKLGKMYKSAKKIYDYEQSSLFLENYGVDILRTYAPVDGVELTCSPKVWNSQDVFDRLGQSIEANTLALKMQGGAYSLKNPLNKYFIVKASVDENVHFINSKEWPKSFEVEPSEGGMLISKPIGNQPGLGMLGFCYVPYHFVYNVKYPVLIQINDGEEFFQFPMAVVIQGNKPRQALADASASEFGIPDLCKYKNTELNVQVYDSSLSPVQADISFECSGTKCEVGKTDSDGNLKELFPQCVNGFVRAKSSGYNDAKTMISTINSANAEILMTKLYPVNVELKLDGKSYSGEAIITFNSDSNSATIVYPSQKEVALSEGQYEITVYVNKNTTLKLAAEKTETCVEAPKSGIGGILGLTEQKCYNVEIPEQTLTSVISGGGKQNYYILESELKEASLVEIYATSLPTPRTINQLQDNYILFEDKGLEIFFK